MPSSPSSQFGPYELLYPLGSGGMGEVFLARHRGDHDIERLVAVKRLLVHLSRQKKLARLFLDEVRIAAQLNHGNIVQVIDHGEVKGQYFMAMEYVHGENLAQVLERLEEGGELISLDLLWYLACCVCEGLDYAHRKESMEGAPLNIVHRDISPHNILLSFQGEVKVADFGVARAAEQTHETIGGELKGKLAYMSPEQATGKPLDHRSDLYSLGVLLYEALAGRNPLRRENSMATLEAVRDPQIPTLGVVRPDLPRDVVDLVHRILSPDRDQRPESARALHEDLGRVARQHQLAASPFDLADSLRELFPESGPRKQQTGGDATAVGRRADADLQDLERNTLFYLRQRHPEQDPTIGLDDHEVETSDTGQIQEQVVGGRKRTVAWMLALGALVAAGAGGGLWLSSQNRPAAAPDGGALPADLSVPRKLDSGGLDARPRRDTAAAEAGRTPRVPAPFSLEVKSSPPGAWVKIGGRRVRGTTPLTVKAHRGRIRCEVGLKGHRSWTETVALRRGRTITVRPRLEPKGGSLTVRSTLTCRVKIKGKLVGEAPVIRHAVEPGKVQVVCLNTALGVREKRWPRVRPGENVEVSFRFGILNINLAPWANVTVDGRARGTTPARLHLTEGEHQVLLRNSKQGLERRRGIEIKAGKVHRISSW